MGRFFTDHICVVHPISGCPPLSQDLGHFCYYFTEYIFYANTLYLFSFCGHDTSVWSFNIVQEFLCHTFLFFFLYYCLLIVIHWPFLQTLMFCLPLDLFYLWGFQLSFDLKYWAFQFQNFNFIFSESLCLYFIPFSYSALASLCHSTVYIIFWGGMVLFWKLNTGPQAY
jgi:hypothetical protein